MNRENPDPRTEVAIVGGGLAGLITAVIVGRRGLHVTLCEQAAELGGLARTRVVDGFSFNIGAHALARAGDAHRILRSLGITYGAGKPAVSGVAVHHGVATKLPATLGALATTRLLGTTDKLQLARFMAQLPRLETELLDSMSLDAWLTTHRFRPRVEALLRSFLCLATYCQDGAQLSAGLALAQLKGGVSKGVEYLDGGWQTLVDGLREAAQTAGVVFRTGAKVEQVLAQDGAVRGLRLTDGTSVEANYVVLACGPAAAANLVADDWGKALRARVAEVVPIRAATLDVALRQLPRAQPTFALGIDEFWYYSVHTAAARLAPTMGALIHLLKYLPTGTTGDPRESERQLESVLDRFQPGWRQCVVHQQFLPAITVSTDLPRAATTGTRQRPGAKIPEIAGLYLAGDWIGPRGHLADASAASAEAAAEQIMLAAEKTPRDARAKKTDGLELHVA